MVEYKIYINVFFCASSFCKSRQTLSYLTLFTFLKYPLVSRRLDSQTQPYVYYTIVVVGAFYV